MKNSRRRWAPRQGSSSNNNNSRRRRVIQQNQTRITDLPPEILHSIMLHVANDFEDHTRARAAFRTIRRVTDDEVYLRDVDLFIMHTSNHDAASIQNFRLTCHHRGNVSALFLQGCFEFYYEGNLENGLSIIRECAIRNYELAIYVYSMLRRIMTPQLHLDLHLMYPDRDLVRRMKHRVQFSRHNYWGPTEFHELYAQRIQAFDSRVVYNCPCAALNLWVRIENETIKAPDICDYWFITIHAIRFSRYFPRKIRRWPFPFQF